MKIDRTEAARIAALAHLDLDDAALERIAADLSKILEYVDQLEEADVEAIEEHATFPATPLRDDVLTPSLERAAVERNAPAFIHGFFVVPKVIGGDS